jgi:broad specificity phosphatase PhoE
MADAVTTTFLLVRHATHGRVGTVLCGRMPGVTLGAEGRAEAERLADHLAGRRIASVHTSPLERARETAEPIAARLGLEAESCEELLEIEFGAWTGRSFASLQDESRWRGWNSARSVSRPPGGETMLEVQARVVRLVERLRATCSDETVVLVSHGDVIKAGLLYCLGLPIDAHARIEVSPASISTLAVGDWGVNVIALNQVVAQVVAQVNRQVVAS